MFVLNYGDQTYLKTSLAHEVTSRLNTRATLGSGTQTAGAVVPLQATIRRTDSWTRIGGLVARAYESTTNGIITRTWYAEGGPLPPHAVRKTLAALVLAGSSVDCSCDDPNGVDDACGAKVAAMEIAGRAALRSEIFDGAQWTVTLNTTDVQWTMEPTAFFAPPGGWTDATASGAPAPPAVAPQVARLAATSAANPGSPSANVSWQGGPVMETPELHVYFVGTGFPAQPGAVSELTAAIKTIVSPSGISAVSEYGVNPGTVKDVHVLGGSLPVPSASVAAFVLGVMIKYGPLFWWETSSIAPLFVVVVDDNDAGSNWNPFHLDTISPTFLLPFPTNFLAHDFMPFALVGAVQGSLSMPAGGPAQRDTCDGSSMEPAAACDALSSFDQSTANLTHEIFEAVTDPYPFQGYMDPSKFPWWDDAEVCDICDTPADSPTNRFTRVGDYVLATAWSNGADDCVGPYQPTITIDLPRSGALYSLADASAGILVEASVWDPIDRGSRLTSEVRWSLDGVPQAFDNASAMGTEVSNMIVINSAGQHVVTASFEDPDNLLPVNDLITINVRDSGPVLVIDSPADGTTVPVGTTIAMAGHGTSLDYPNGVPTFLLNWYMGNALLGNGSTLTTTLNRAGDVTIALESVDNAGLLGTASVTLHVVEPANGPKVTITSPGNGFAPTWSINSACNYYALTCPIAVTFTATATNPDGTAIDPSQIQWSDSQDGPVGTGASVTHTFTFPYCVNGSASMTASVAGPNGTSTDSVTISFLSRGC